MPHSLQWRSFYTLVYSNQGRNASIIPIPLSAEWVRIEITVLTFPRPTWYRAGWINQVFMVQGKPYLMPALVAPLAPSMFNFAGDSPYYLRFKPVTYLPNAIVRFSKSI